MLDLTCPTQVKSAWTQSPHQWTAWQGSTAPWAPQCALNVQTATTMTATPLPAVTHAQQGKNAQQKVLHPLTAVQANTGESKVT